MIVGKTLGVSALAGVGATSSINFMIIGFCMGICSGFAIPVAQQFGAGKYSELRKYVFNGYVCSAVFAVVMTILSVVFCAPILRLLNTPDDIFMHAYNYIVIIFAGIPTVFLYNIVPKKLRPVVLLLASYLFFWSISGKLILFLLISTFSIHHFGLWLSSLQEERNRILAETERPKRKAVKAEYIRRQRWVISWLSAYI